MRFKGRRAFTLIELLVVVAIIALLIAILLPSLARAKMSATRAACASNMKSWALAANQYAMEWDEWIVIKMNSGPAGNWPSSPSVYQKQLTNAGTARAITCCPHWKDTIQDPQHPPVVLVMMRPLQVDFTMGVSATVYKRSDCNHPFSMMLWSDYKDISQQDTSGGYCATWQQLFLAGLGPQGLADDHYRGIGNVVFMDGHVEAHNWDDYQNTDGSLGTGVPYMGKPYEERTHPWSYLHYPN